MKNEYVQVDPRFISAPGKPERVLEVGGKAANLEILRDAGFNVPEFRIIAAVRFAEFIADIGKPLSDTISDEAAGDITQAIMTASFSQSFQNELFEMFSSFNGKPLCVRSSGVFEDLEGASFAGQYESKLNIHNFRDFQIAVRLCWSSLLNSRVRGYFASRKLSLSRAGIALVVQEYIEADYSGVVFSVDPVTGIQEHSRMEYCSGCGEKLVSGQVKPESVVFDNSSEKAVKGILPAELSPDQMRVFRDIQVLFGSPQDIEWVVKNDELRIVQSRPITGIQVDRSFGVWTTADFRDGGVASSVVTPYMWSLYDYIWQRSMPGYFEIIGLLDPEQKKKKWGNVFYGRPYWNLGEVVHSLLKIPGFKEKNLFSDLGIQTEEAYNFREVPYSIKNIISVLPTLLKLEKYYKKRIEDNKKFRKDFSSMVREFVEIDLKELSDEQFAKKYYDLITIVYNKTETSYFMTIYNTSNAKLDFKVRLDDLNKSGFGISYINLISGLLRMKHLAPMKAMVNLAKDIRAIPGLREKLSEQPVEEFETTLNTFSEAGTISEKIENLISEYGYHSSRELDISIPRWVDDRKTVYRVLKTYLRDLDIGSTIAHERAQYNIYRAEVASARKAFSRSIRRFIPFEKTLFFRALLRTRSYCWWREEIRDYSSRVYSIIRQYAVEGGRRLGLKENEVFWLTWQQLYSALTRDISLEKTRKILETAINYSKSFRSYKNPDELGAGFLSKPLYSGKLSEKSNFLSGEGCCAGVKEGTARIVLSLENIDRIQRGEILVTKFTDPGWTPVFHLLGGIITETGGVLSHAAVISREYGIPAVLNISSATSIIPDGARIKIDGSTGSVEIL
ncbi:MAG: hypothetical protein HQM10_24350 [Candidatus Riflebacteria bacterium]|nr:hypothetical protein [Candidatus Riflebacteria bacterium]